MKKHTPAMLTFLISLVAATTLLAADEVPPPQVQQAGNVQYLNGGAGTGERDAMRAHQGEFPLQILFSGQAGELGVADQVRVMNASGQVVAVQNAGPLLMLKLPPGRYTVEADFKGQVQRRTVSLGQGPQMVHWATAAVSNN